MTIAPAFSPADGTHGEIVIPTAAVRLAKYAQIHTVGRRSGSAHRTTVCFAWSQGAIYVLAHRRPDGAPGDWYRNAIAAGAAEVEISGLRMRVSAQAAANSTLARQLVIALLLNKYGNTAVTSWHPSTGAIPIRLQVVACETLQEPGSAQAAGPA